jgi:hypothetical protein
MCQIASFLYKYDNDKLEIAVYDLASHSNTQDKLKLTEKQGWFEGHYTINDIVCRIPEGRNELAEKELKYKYNSFTNFLNYCFTQPLAYLKLHFSNYSVKGLVFNDTFNGCLTLINCKNLNDCKMPNVITGWLDIAGGDMSNVKLPKEIKGYVFLFGCKNFKTTQFPDVIGGFLDLCYSDIEKEGVSVPPQFLARIIYNRNFKYS